MKQIEIKILNRIDELVHKGEQAKNHYVPSPPNTIGLDHVDYTVFHEWKSNSENLILKVTGKNNHYYKNFLGVVQKSQVGDIESGIGILKALQEDIQSGFLLDVKELAIAEVFTDFLEMAKHLLTANY